MKVVAKAVFFIEGDPDAHEYQADVVEWQGVRWFVANRVMPNGSATSIPAQLIPMDRLPHVVLESGLIRLRSAIAKEMGHFPIPPRQQREFAVVTLVNPALVQNPPDKGCMH